MKTGGMAERVRSQLRDYELETNFVVVDNDMWVAYFLLGSIFLRAYQVLLDLTSMKIVVRSPVRPVWHHTHTQVGDFTLAVPVALDVDLVVQPFERTVVKARVLKAMLCF